MTEEKSGGLQTKLNEDKLYFLFEHLAMGHEIQIKLHPGHSLKVVDLIQMNEANL